MAQSNQPYPNQPDVPPEYVDAKPPPSARPAAPAAEGKEPADPPADGKHREGECVPNVPDVRPDVLSEKETGTFRRQKNDAEAETLRGIPVPGWLRWSYFAATLLLAAVFGLFLFSQAISSLALAATLPPWAQYLLLAPLAFCCLVVLCFIVSLAWSWMRLRSVRQVNLAALEELRQRAESRKDGLRHLRAARKNLERYLRDYPLTGREASRLAATARLDEEMDSLAREREYLLGRESDSRAWLDDFQRLFQAKLDKAAAGRINSWALKAAGCVMASPLPLLDAILVLAISLRMIRELCVIYNVRTGGTATMLLLTRAIRNAFIAGVAEDASDMAGEMLGDEVSAVLGDSAFGTASASLARVVAPKLGEGALNGLFMRRLGKATIRMLQPLGSRPAPRGS